MQTSARIKEALAKALVHEGVDKPHVQLEFPGELVHGDYASNAALQYAKELGVSPRSLAERLVGALGSVEGVSKIDIAGPGFINFHISPSGIAGSMRQAIETDMWGANDVLSKKKIMVEYTDPNPFKEFHIGHLMSNAIGEAIARLFQFSGAEVRRANYQGDVGPHVAKAIWGYKKIQEDGAFEAVKERKLTVSEKKEDFERNQWGIAYKLGNAEYERDFGSVKDEIDEINKKIYDRSDPAINQIYDKGREESLAHFEKLYALLGTKFDYYFFESQTAHKGLELVRGNPSVFVESDGAVVYKGEDEGLHTRVFITSKGLPTYETKDLGLALMKADAWEADTYVTVTANEQKDYFRVVLAAMRKVVPMIAEKIQHITHGMMRFADGKMSSRTGNVITGESLINSVRIITLNRGKERRAEDVERIGTDTAIGAIKYQILKQTAGKDIIFDLDRALSIDGDSGPYLQYAHARAHQICDKALQDGTVAQIDDASVLSDVSRLIHRFPEVVAYATRLHEPHVLTNYLVALASAFNSWYAQEHILDGTPAAAHKVAITAAVRRTLKNGLWVLGIPAPEKM